MSSINAHSNVINAESLTEGQRRAVTRYLELSGATGVLVGAHAGEAPWDLRPLILEAGALQLLRFSDPALALDKKRYLWLKELFERRTGRTTGEGAGQLWVKRRYYPAVFADDTGQIPASLAERFALIASIISQLRPLHQSGVPHGHPSLSNLALDEHGVVLLDAGFYLGSSVKRGDSFTAPELTRSFPPTTAADIYALGNLIRMLLKEQMGGELASMVQSMQAATPATRPSLEEVAGLFAGHSAPRTASRPESSGAATAPRAGKVIAATVKSAAPDSPSPSTSSPRSPSQNPPSLQAPPPSPTPSPKTSEEVAADLKHTLLIPREVIDQVRHRPANIAAPQTQEPALPTAEERLTSSSPTTKASPGATPFAAGSFRIGSRRQAALVLAGLLVAAVLVVRWLQIPDLLMRKRYDIPVVEYWKSGQKPLMQQVAEAAVLGRDEGARAAIIEGVKAGEAAPFVRAGILRFVFDSRWADRLSDADRDIAVRLALAPLFPDGVKGLPPLQELNPIILVAILGDLPLETSGKVFESIPSQLLAALPEPLGTIFAPTVSSVSSLADRSIRSLAHLVLGDPSENAFQYYFTGADPRERLRAALPILVSNAQLAAPLLQYFEQGQTILSDYAKWFSSEDLAQWGQVAPRIRLFIMAGKIPPSGLSLEQYADLLQFPDMQIRSAAATAVMSNFLSSEQETTIAFLGGDSNQLGRFQTIALVAGLKLDSESYYAFLTRWFGANPDPGTILRLLLVRSQSTGIDPLNFQAASYLKRSRWEASLKDLSALANHPEALARALAYSKLDPSIPNELAILKEALKREPKDNFRDELARRIREAQQR